MIGFVLAIPAAGFLYRHRGGWLPTGHTQLARFDFSLGMTLLMMLVTWDWHMCFSLPLWFIGCLAPNGDWMNVANRQQFIWGIYSGLLNVGPVVVLAALFSYWPLAVALLVAGALKGPMYLLAKFIPMEYPQFHRGPELGEFTFGLCLGAALYLGTF